MFYSKHFLKLNKFHLTKNFFNILPKRFSEVVPTTNNQQEINIPKSFDELIYKNSSLTAEEIANSQKLGVDLFLNQQKLSVIENSGYYFNNLDKLNLKINSEEGWRLNYLKNMGLLNEYDDIFREFLQNSARLDENGLNLFVEPRLAEFMKLKLLELKNFGFNLEVNTIKIRQNYRILRMEIYKNLFIDRNLNGDYSKYSFSKVPTGLASMIIAKIQGEDYSIVQNKKPFILATTMLVQSPMKMSVWNQNQSKEFKLKDQEIYEYVVRFETQMNYSDFGWILPTQNKPSRIKDTKITDFNNILRGNPYFAEKYDLVDDSLRYKYMVKDSKLDEEAKEYFNNFRSSYA